MSSLEACWRLYELQACMGNRQGCLVWAAVTIKSGWPQRKAPLNAFNMSNQIDIQFSLSCFVRRAEQKHNLFYDKLLTSSYYVSSPLQPPSVCTHRHTCTHIRMDIQTCTCAHTYIFIFRTQKWVDNLSSRVSFCTLAPRSPLPPRSASAESSSEHLSQTEQTRSPAGQS